MRGGGRGREKTGKNSYAAMAQQVEHVLGKDEVTGSNPVSSSSEKPQDIVVFLSFSGKTLNQRPITVR